MLEVNRLFEHRIFWLFPNLDTEREVGTLNDIAPEASNHDVVFHFVSLNQNTIRIEKNETYCLTGHKATHCPVRNIVGGETRLKSKSSLAPCRILFVVDERGHFLYVECEVPINHVSAHIIALLVVCAQPRIPITLDVVAVVRVVAADDRLKRISLLEFHVIEVDDFLQDALAAVILSHKLDQLIDDPLEVRIGLITNLAVAIQVHEELHALTLRISCLTDEGEEEESTRQDLQLLVVQVNVECVLAGSIW